MPEGNEVAGGVRRGKARIDDLIELMINAHALGVRVCVPATVASYDPATQKANVILGFLTARITDDGEVPDLPLQINVPVEWMRTSTGYLTFPLVPGDTGKVVICDRSLEKWLQTGSPTDPGLRTTHQLIDGVFQPGLHPDIDPITPPTSLTHTVLEGVLIKLGVGATTEAAVLGTIFLSLYNDLVTKFNAHIHVTTATVGASPTVGVLSPTVSPASPMVPGTHTSAKVTVE